MMEAKDLISKVLIEDSDYPDEFEEYIFTYNDDNNIDLVEEKDWSTSVITYDGNKAFSQEKSLKKEFWSAWML